MYNVCSQYIYKLLKKKTQKLLVFLQYLFVATITPKYGNKLVKPG